MLSKLQKKIYQLLKSSEKYTKTDMVYLAKGGSWVTAGQVLSSLSTFLLAIAFANLLPKEIYGKYKYILSVVGILSMTTLSGIDTTVIRDIARGLEGSFLSSLKMRIKWGLLGSLCSLTIGAYYLYKDNFTLAASFALVSFFIPLFESGTLYQAYFNGKKDFKKLTKYYSLAQILSALSIFISIYFTDNIFIILLAYFVTYTLIRYLYILLIIKKNSLNKELDKSSSSYGKHLSFANLISTIGNQLDKILLFNHTGAVELAVYSFAIAPLEQFKSLIKPINTLASPKFATADIKEIKKTIFKKMAIFSFILAVVAIIYIILAPYLYKIIFPQYLEAVKYSQIFAISLVTLPLLTIISIFQSQKMLKEIYIFNVASSISQIIFTFVMIYYYGLMGAILARVLQRFIGLILSSTLLKVHKK